MKDGIGIIDADLHKAEIGGQVLIDVGDFPKDLQTAVAPDGVAADVRQCRVCGCTEDDCSRCVAAQGHACHWVADNLCSRCEDSELFS